MLFTSTLSSKKLQRYANKLLNSLNFDSTSSTANSLLSLDGLTLNYESQWVDDCAINLLNDLAVECQLSQKIEKLMSGYPINKSESKPALHTALRTEEAFIFVEGHNVVEDILCTKEKMYAIASQIRNGTWLGYTGKRITDVVNIGIGGSHLGPEFCVESLYEYKTSSLQFHFIINVGNNEFKRVTSNLNPETTLFIISSKSFLTLETLENAKKAQAWFGDACKDQHFIAVTSNPGIAQGYGFKHILTIWDWVGGRFSFFSAINLIGCIAIGPNNFSKMLLGANKMDKHFRHCEFTKNLPVMLALIGIWNNNFLQIHLHLLMTYSENLQLFVSFIQQVEMESNGKSIDIEGRAVNYATCPIIWGGSGFQAQHSYYQLLSQGTHRLVADLISVNDSNHTLNNQICKAHKKVLSQGIHESENPNGYIPGNMPMNHIYLESITPENIGMLVALYEHKVFIQSVIWDINPFDQPGVDTSKKIFEKYSSSNIDPIPQLA